MIEQRVDRQREAPGFAELLEETRHEFGKLVRLEIELAKEEIRTATRRQARSIATFAVGAAFAFANFILLVWAAIYALALIMPIWAAVLIVGGFGLCVGGAVALAGREKLHPEELKPEATIESTRRSVRYLVDRVRPRTAARGGA